MKQVLFLILFSLMLLSSIGASSITRDLQSTIAPGDTLTVSIEVEITDQNKCYFLTENFPQEFQGVTASDEGGIIPGRVRWATLQGATTRTLTYTLTAPLTEGTYTFNGTHVFCEDATSSEITTLGNNSIIVTTTPSGPVCGDQTCNGSETCATCEGDCGTCSTDPLPTCGDGTCSPTENCFLCAADCGICSVTPTCGDTICNGTETCTTCSGDCGACPPVGPITACPKEFENKCIKVDGKEMTCLNGTYVNGCISEQSTGSSSKLLERLSDPIIFGILVVVTIIFVIGSFLAFIRAKREDML